MAKLNPVEFAEKWGRRLKASTPDITKGIDRVTEAPGVKAAAQVEKLKQNFNKKVDDGTWARNVQVPLSEWKDKFKNVGVGRISGGVDKAKSKMEKFGAKLIPHVEAGQSKIDAMPKLTPEDSDARMISWSKHMRTFKK